MDMLNSKQKAVGLLLVLGSILVLIATWDTSEGDRRHKAPERRDGFSKSWTP